MSWLNSSLENVSLLFTDGDWIETKDQSDDGIRLVQTGNVGIGQFKDRVEKARYISEATYNRLKCTEILPGDCLVSRLPDPPGRACILPDTGEKMITAVDCTIIRFNPDKILPQFFNYHSQSEEYLKAVSKQCTGATRQRISRKKLGEIFIPLPSIPEQRRIVEMLDEAFEGIDAAIANTEKNLANTRKLFGNYIETIFSSDDKNWTNCLIGEVCTLKSGTTVPVGIEKSDGDIPYVKVAEMTMEENLDGIYTSIRFLNYADIKKNWIIPKGATIFPKRGGAILTNKKRILLRDVCLDLNIMAVIPSDKIMPEFLYIYFLNVDMRKLGNGSSIPQINNVDIAPLKFAFPSNKEEQQKVIEEFKVIEEGYNLLLKSYEHKLNLLSELKKSILQKAFRGELTPSSDALAEVAA